MANGKQAWQWIEGHSDRHGVLVVPGDMTVGQVEAACGKGAVTAARKYCQRYLRGEFGAHFPLALRSMSIVDYEMSQGRTREEAERYCNDYWMPRYGTDRCSHSVPDGCEIPSDRVQIHYPVLA